MAAAGSAFDARDFTWMAQLPGVWDRNRCFRERSLHGTNLLKGIIMKGHGDAPVVVGNLECCKLNADVLATILKIMGDVGCIFVPKVFLLQGACLEFHCNAGYPDALTLGGAAYSDGSLVLDSWTCNVDELGLWCFEGIWTAMCVCVCVCESGQDPSQARGRV